MKIRLFLVCILIIIACTLFIYLDNTLVKLTSYTVTNGKLPPEFDGFKIIQLSDIHGAEFGNGNSRLISKIKAAEPDIVLITGDIVNNTEDNAVEVFENIMTQLDNVAPMYGVTGNHDGGDLKFPSYIEKWEREHNITWLFDETVTITRGGSVIYLSGIADPKVYDKTECREIVEKSISSMPVHDGYNILMFHRADMLSMFIGEPYDLVFSGHLHGGQWRIPFAGGLISPGMELFPEYSGGKYERGDNTFIVSCGLGNKQTFLDTDILIPRIFNMAEIVEVVLRPAD